MHTGKKTAEVSTVTKKLIVATEETKKLHLLATDSNKTNEDETFLGQLAAIVASSEDAIISKSLDGVIRTWNKGSENMFGYTAQQAVGKNITLIIPEEYLKEEKEIIERISRNETIQHYETVRRKKTGEQFYVSLTVSPLKNRLGTIMGVSKIARDITGQKIAEAELIRANDELKSTTEALRNSNDLFLKLFDYNPVAIAIGNTTDGKLLNINEAFLKLYGFTNKAEVIGKSTVELNLVSAENRLKMHLELQEEVVKYYEVEAQTKSGVKLWVSISVLKLEVNGAASVVAVINDITGLKKTEEQLTEANQELEAFSYSVSHDLRAPLRAIHGYTKMLQGTYGTTLDTEGNRLMDNISDNAQKMGQLIDDLLTFSRIGRKELSMMKINMQELVTAIGAELKKIQPERAITITVKDLLPAMGDYSAIKQVWFNLLSNAIKYSQHKESTHIEIGSEAVGNEIIYHIKDHGAGFDMRYADKLFGVFQRLHSDEEFEGTGVGLALVQRLVFKHGGRVWGEGHVNQGATFYFTLPKTT